MIHIIAIVTALPGQRGAVLREFQKNLPFVRLERGCIRYEPAIDVEGGPAMLTRIGPDAFMVIEQWESQDAAQDHATSAHMAAYAGRVSELLVSHVIYAVCAI